jgi:hypothetical protein
MQIEGISVIIPTFNRNNYLIRIIKILNTQSKLNKNFEIIIIDSKICNFLNTIQFPNFKYFRISCNSNAKKRNFGIKKAKYNNIIFLDDDCFPGHNFLNIYRNIFKKINKKEIVCGSVIYDTQDIKNNNYLKLRAKQHFVLESRIKFDKVKTLLPATIVTMNMGLKLNKNLNYFDNRFGNYGFEDFEFAYRFIKNGYKFYQAAPLVTHKDNRSYIKYFNKFYFLGNKSTEIFKKINIEAFRSSNYFKIEKILSFIFIKDSFVFKQSIKILLVFITKIFRFRFIQNQFFLKMGIIIYYIYGLLNINNRKNRRFYDNN